MPVFRGNIGNLMQHWVLCEILAAWQDSANRVDFIDAYSMAPLADERPKRDPSAGTFDYVQRRLPGDETPYERAWHALAPIEGLYPSSAAFLTEVWQGEYSLILCEFDAITVRELRRWQTTVEVLPRCAGLEVSEGDWRDRFRRGFSPSDGLTLLSFDPYMISKRITRGNPANMDPSDFDLIASAVRPLRGPLVMQLSTYSANGENRQPEVITATHAGLSPAGLEQLAVVRANGHMMSMLYGRNLREGPRLHDLPGRFDSWLAEVKAAYSANAR